MDDLVLEMLAMLERLEYAGSDACNAPECPVCHEMNERGHRPDCALAALLKRAKEQLQ